MLLLAPPIATEPTLAVRCLGRLHVAADGRPLGSPVNRRARSVLKYLVLHRGRSTPRDVLMELLWPDSAPDAARNNLKPELDLSAGFSYAGLTENSLVTAYERSFYTNRHGPSFNLQLSLQWPVGNNQARGALETQLAQEQTAAITVRDLESTIASNVRTQLRGLLHSVAQLTQGIESVRRYGISVQNELTKRRLGSATLLDVVNMQDRLVAAQVNETQLRQAYANAIAQLRFETGSLVRSSDGGYDFRARDVLYPEFSPAR